MPPAVAARVDACACAQRYVLCARYARHADAPAPRCLPPRSATPRARARYLPRRFFFFFFFFVLIIDKQTDARLLTRAADARDDIKIYYDTARYAMRAAASGLCASRRVRENAARNRLMYAQRHERACSAAHGDFAAATMPIIPTRARAAAPR